MKLLPSLFFLLALSFSLQTQGQSETDEGDFTLDCNITDFKNVSAKGSNGASQEFIQRQLDTKVILSVLRGDEEILYTKVFPDKMGTPRKYTILHESLDVIHSMNINQLFIDSVVLDVKQKIATRNLQGGAFNNSWLMECGS